jgi:hypothetical protein
MVFFSEKTYWYPPGYELLGLVLFYAFPTFVCLWAIQTFRVRSLAPLFLCGALFGLIVEGVITTVVYEGGWSWVHVSYTPLAWHAPLSVVFGWYYLRKLLLQGNTIRLAGVSAAYGVFWGAWSLVYWLPENINDPAFLAEGIVGGAWPIASFALYTFTFTGVLAICHWLLGRGIWMSEFKPSRIETGLVWLIIVAYFVFITVPQVPIVWLKLSIIVGVIFLALWSNYRRERRASVFKELEGPIGASQVLALFSMPLAATAVYGIATVLQPAESLIRGLLWEGVVIVTTFAGAFLFLAALLFTFLPQKREGKLAAATLES